MLEDFSFQDLPDANISASSNEQAVYRDTSWEGLNSHRLTSSHLIPLFSMFSLLFAFSFLKLSNEVRLQYGRRFLESCCHDLARAPFALCMSLASHGKACSSLRLYGGVNRMKTAFGGGYLSVSVQILSNVSSNLTAMTTMSLLSKIAS